MHTLIETLQMQWTCVTPSVSHLDLGRMASAAGGLRKNFKLVGDSSKNNANEGNA